MHASGSRYVQYSPLYMWAIWFTHNNYDMNWSWTDTIHSRSAVPRLPHSYSLLQYNKTEGGKDWEISSQCLVKKTTRPTQQQALIQFQPERWSPKHSLTVQQNKKGRANEDEGEETNTTSFWSRPQFVSLLLPSVLSFEPGSEAMWILSGWDILIECLWFCMKGWERQTVCLPSDTFKDSSTLGRIVFHQFWLSGCLWCVLNGVDQSAPQYCREPSLLLCPSSLPHNPHPVPRGDRGSSKFEQSPKLIPQLVFKVLATARGTHNDDMARMRNHHVVWRCFPTPLCREEE